MPTPNRTTNINLVVFQFIVWQFSFFPLIPENPLYRLFLFKENSYQLYHPVLKKAISSFRCITWLFVILFDVCVLLSYTHTSTQELSCLVVVCTK